MSCGHYSQEPRTIGKIGNRTDTFRGSHLYMAVHQIVAILPNCSYQPIEKPAIQLVPQVHGLGYSHAAVDTQPKLCTYTAVLDSMSKHYQQGRSTERTWVKDQLHALRLRV